MVVWFLDELVGWLIVGKLLVPGGLSRLRWFHPEVIFL